jgi:hypothetical protein
MIYFLFLEYFMNEGGCDRSFAYCRCNTLDAAASNVTDHENLR